MVQKENEYNSALAQNLFHFVFLCVPNYLLNYTCLVPMQSPSEALALLRSWRARLTSDLFASILPFWAAHSEDAECGGFFNCLDEDGGVYDATKHVWLQGRQVYMYARLCSEYSEAEFAALVAAHPAVPAAVAAPGRSVAAATPTPLTRAGLLAAAERGAAFLLAHAVSGQGTEGEAVYFALARDGTPAAAQRKPFSAAFLALALGELGTATGKAAYREQALHWLQAYLRWCSAPGGAGAALGKPGCPGAPPLAPLNEPMITLNLISELGRGLPTAQERAAFFATERQAAEAAVLAHVSPAHRAVLESVHPGTGAPDLSCSAGRLMNPGHAIEMGWFLLDCAELQAEGGAAAPAAAAAALRQSALQVIDWAYEGGWDGPLAGSPPGALGAPAAEAEAAGSAAGQGSGAGSGGIVYFRDALGYSPTQLEAHAKLWWPQAEAMIALAKAYRVGGAAAHLARFDQVATWTYKHLVSSSGEWYGYADRAGAVTHRFKGGPYKGCFHVPRAVFLCQKELGLAIAALEAQGVA